MSAMQKMKESLCWSTYEDCRKLVDPDYWKSEVLNEITYRIVKKFATTSKDDLNDRWTNDLPGRLDLLVSGLKDKLETSPERTLWPPALC